MLSNPAVSDIPAYTTLLTGPSAVQVTTQARLTGLRTATVPGIDASTVEYPDSVTLPTDSAEGGCNGAPKAAYGTTTFGHREIIALPAELGLPLLDSSNNNAVRNYRFGSSCPGTNMRQMCMLGTTTIDNIAYEVWVTPGGVNIVMPHSNPRRPPPSFFTNPYAWEFDPVISGQ